MRRPFPRLGRAGRFKGRLHDVARLFLQDLEMFAAKETLGIDLIDVLGA